MNQSAREEKNAAIAKRGKMRVQSAGKCECKALENAGVKCKKTHISLVAIDLLVEEKQRFSST